MGGGKKTNTRRSNRYYAGIDEPSGSSLPQTKVRKILDTTSACSSVESRNNPAKDSGLRLRDRCVHY